MTMKTISTKESRIYNPDFEICLSSPDDDGKHHRNTQSHSEQKVARVSDDIFQVIVNDFTIRENFLATFASPMFRRFPYHHIFERVLSEWIEDICCVTNSGELKERDKILDVLEQLPLSEVFDQRITERAVMHRKRNTDIAQDRDESFQVSVSRRIVAIVDKWMEEIFSVMNSGELEERDKILDVLEQLSLSEVLDQRITERAVMHRKRNTDIAQDRDESFQVSVSRRIVAIVVKWMEEIFSVMNSGELEERDKILDVLKQLPLSEVFDQRITGKAVMHRKRNTNIAQDRDESFEVSVRRRIVAIVARWLRQIFVLINRGGVEERGINISSSVYRHNSTTFSRKRNCYRLN
ncbi:uncharacterized protein LOC114973389 [Acropora millepora]|uniref:uncharacterized protein LOC114973389 n=1 Tax=Acropora millepora TaxID=45264 RepID=UPI001CF3CDB5|nr:uncharacterized protein LOC114973389 [Acropora millepora]